MAQNLQEKKNAFLADVIALSEQLLKDVKACEELDAYYFSNGFNMILGEADIGTVYSHLTPAIVASFITACQAVTAALTQGHRDNLRKAGKKAQF